MLQNRELRSGVTMARLVCKDRSWIIMWLICLVLMMPTYVAAQITEPVPPDLCAPKDCRADFVVFGDSQGPDGHLCPVATSFGNMLNLINEIDVPMAFHLGDMYIGDYSFSMAVDEQAEQFLSEMMDLNITWWPVMGNHDSAGDGWEITRDMVFQGGSTYYSFDADESHFIVLDAFMPDYENRISEEQFSWLKDDLNRIDKPHVFVFVHAPLYPLGPHLSESLDVDIALRDRLAMLLKEYGVDVVFNGHEHFYAAFEYQGLLQVTAGGSGGILRNFADLEELVDEYGYSPDQITRWKAVKTLHYVCVTTGDDWIEISAYDLGGNLIDSFRVPS